MIIIEEYKPIYQNGIDRMLNEICIEYSLETNNADYKPKLPDLYWVALHQNIAVGTLGINKANRHAVLKRMFVKKEFRGKEWGIAILLIDTAFNWCINNNVNAIYLGTMEVFKAAQRFYEKNGFQKIPRNELPIDFQNNPADSIFYKIDI